MMAVQTIPTKQNRVYVAAAYQIPIQIMTAHQYCNDNCQNDPNKTEPGICGCGIADTDSDGDQIPDCNDALPNDPIQKGDINNDGNLDLTDAILALQVLTGTETFSTVHKEADVNGDGRTGIEEAIYALQIVSEIRSQSGNQV